MVEIGPHPPLAAFSGGIPCRGHSACQGHLVRPPRHLVWPPLVRLFAQPTHAREASRQHPAGNVDAYAHTHAHADELWGPQYVPLSLIRTRSMYISYVPGAGGLSQGTGTMSQGTGALTGNGRAVAGRDDSAHQHRLIQQEAVAIFGLVVLWCSGCLLYTSPSPRDLSTSRMPSSA